jgi:hypothetical protein
MNQKPAQTQDPSFHSSKRCFSYIWRHGKPGCLAAFSLARDKVGKRTGAKIAMMAMTTRSSMSANAPITFAFGFAAVRNSREEWLIGGII